MADEYATHARDLHARAKAAHREWVAKLTPKGRAFLERAGLLAPPEDSTEVGGHSPWQSLDAAESPSARTVPDPTECDTPAERIAEAFDIPLPLATRILDWHELATRDAIYQSQSDLLAIVVGGLLAAKYVRISTAGLAFAANLAATNNLGTPAKFARSLRVSRSALSKSTKAWQRQLQLEPSPHQKSAEACEVYSRIGRTNHWRKQKVSASALLSRLRPQKSDPSCS